MKIIKLESENIKKIKAIEIKPNGAIVRVTGKNANGKTSVLDSILYALGGEKAIPSTPIRQGASKAHITLDLGDMVVERNITKKGSYLKVTGKDGKNIGSPQRMLDNLVGRLSFDPLSFSRETPKKQADILRELAGLDTSDLDDKEARMMEDRRNATAEGKALAARLEAMPNPVGDLTQDEVNVDVLQERLSDSMETNKAIDNAEHLITRITQDIEDNKDELTKLEHHIKSLRNTITEHEAELEQANKERAKLGVPVETGDIMNAIRNAHETNRAIREAGQYRALAAEVDSARINLRKQNKAIEVVRDERAQRIAQANYPLPELSISDDGEVMHNGFPISQASLAEQLKVSTAVAMSLNPKLRVIRITDGSLLDSESMGVIEKLAKTNDYQIWVEQVDESGEVGFYIEDGSLVAVNGEAIE